jgi:hypothetical protein
MGMLTLQSESIGTGGSTIFGGMLTSKAGAMCALIRICSGRMFGADTDIVWDTGCERKGTSLRK